VDVKGRARKPRATRLCLCYGVHIIITVVGYHIGQALSTGKCKRQWFSLKLGAALGRHLAPSNPSAYSCLVYNYYSDVGNPSSCATPSAGVQNNGNVAGYWYQDSVNSYSHTAAYTYDSLNRLTAAMATPSGSGTISYNLNFNNYDRYGNMTCVTNAQTNGPCPSLAYNTASNQISNNGFSYDAVGNVLTDGTGTGSNSYTWDAEGRVASLTPYGGSTQTMTYNALGSRVYLSPPGWSYLTNRRGISWPGMRTPGCGWVRGFWRCTTTTLRGPYTSRTPTH